MEIPPEISFRNVEPSERHREKILKEIDKLERFHDRITRCRVVVEMPHRHAERGNLYHVGIRVTVPTTELVVSRDQGDRASHTDLDAAITDSFQTMRRQLEDCAEQLRGEQRKASQPVRSGKVVRLMPEEGYGFVRTPDGRDVYFHEDTLVSAELDDLNAQTPVRFTEEQGDKGPQAREVHVLRDDPLPSTEED